MNLKALILAAVVSIGFAAGAQAGFVKVEASGSFSPNIVSDPADHPNFDSNADWSLSFLYDMDAVAELVSTTEVFRLATAVQNLDLRLNNQPVAIAPDVSSIVSFISLIDGGRFLNFQILIRLDPGDPIFVGSAATSGVFQLDVVDSTLAIPLFTNQLDLGSVNLTTANNPDSTNAFLNLFGPSGIVAQSTDFDDAEAVFTEVPAPLPLALMLAGMGAIALRRFW